MSEQERIDRLERAVLLITDRVPLYKDSYHLIFCMGCGNSIEKHLFDSLKHTDDCPVAEIEAFRKAVEKDKADEL